MEKTRNSYLGGLKELPMNINDINMMVEWKNNFTKLDNNLINTNYTVIYCIAKLKKKIANIFKLL